MQHRERIALEKICAEIELALKFIENVSSEEFLADELTKYAVGMAAINIGELTKHLTMELQTLPVLIIAAICFFFSSVEPYGMPP